MLYFGAEYLIKSGKKIAYIMNISPVVVGITIVAFGTSLPELFVSVISNINGHSQIALGNIIGSNISNIGLVLGLTAIFKPIRLKFETVKIDFYFLVLISILFFILCIFNFLNRYIGLLFIVLLSIYLKNLVHRKQISSDPSDNDGNVYLQSLIIFFSSALLYAGTEYFVNGAKGIAQLLGFNNSVVGLTLVAFGTSAPELATSFIAVRKKEYNIIIGNIIGSNLFNILAVMGITLFIKPIIIKTNIFIILIIFLMLSLLLPLILYYRNKVSRIEGIIAFLVYLFFLYQSFNYV